jgi:hypothetical protein
VLIGAKIFLNKLEMAWNIFHVGFGDERLCDPTLGGRLAVRTGKEVATLRN